MAGAAYSILHDGRDRETWLEARRNSIGASEAAAICGVSSWSSPLKVFVAKTIGEDSGDDPIRRFGRIFEPQIVLDYSELTKRRVRLDGRLIASRRRPWQSCTLDAVQWDPSREDRGLLEIKTSLYGWESEGIPLAYYTQVQHQFAVTGFKWGSIAMFNRTTCEVVHRDVDPDPEFIRQLTLRESRFWHRNVLPGITPEVEDDDDTEATRRALLRLYPESTPGAVVTLGVREMKSRDRWAFAKANISRYTSMRDAAANRIKAKIGDAEVGVFSDGSGFTFKSDRRGVRTLRYKEKV